MVGRVRHVLLYADEIDCMVGNKAFGMECMGDEPCDASPILFRLGNMAAVHGGSLYVTFFPTAPALAIPNSRSTWHKRIRVLLIRFPVRVGGMPCLDLG